MVENASPGKHSSQRPRVIVAEDDAEMRRLLAETLTRDGYDVVDVGSGLALFDRLRADSEPDVMPALVISDIRMPGHTGLEVLETIRAAGSTVPVILITAFGDEDTMDEGARLGAACVFSKPFDLDDLRAAAMRLAPLLGH